MLVGRRGQSFSSVHHTHFLPCVSSLIPGSKLTFQYAILVPPLRIVHSEKNFFEIDCRTLARIANKSRVVVIDVFVGIREGTAAEVFETEKGITG